MNFGIDGCIYFFLLIVMFVFNLVVRVLTKYKNVFLCVAYG